MTAEKATENRLVEWSKRLLISEIENDYRLSRLIPSSACRTTIRALERLGGGEHLNILGRPASRTDIETMWLRAFEPEYHDSTYDQALRSSFSLFCSGAHYGTVNSAERLTGVPPSIEVTRELWPSGKPSKKVRVQGLRINLRKKLAPLIGPVERGDDEFAPTRSEWRHVLRVVGGWSVQTRFDTGGWYQIRYDQTLFSPVGTNVGAISGVAPALGFPIGGNGIDALGEHDADLAADLLHLLCKMFIDEVPQLIGG